MLALIKPSGEVHSVNADVRLLPGAFNETPLEALIESGWQVVPARVCPVTHGSRFMALYAPPSALDDDRFRFSVVLQHAVRRGWPIDVYGVNDTDPDAYPIENWLKLCAGSYVLDPLYNMESEARWRILFRAGWRIVPVSVVT